MSAALQLEPEVRPARRRLPGRDLFLLPLLAVATVAVMAAGSEFAARVLMPQQDMDACMRPNPVFGELPSPSCVSRTKSAEGEWVANRYNECGYRSESSCGPAAPNALRFAVVGSSTSWGFKIPTAETWWSRMGTALSRDCGRPTDVQDLGGIFNFDQIAARVPDALALKPAAVVMIITPFDLERLPDGDFDPDYARRHAGDRVAADAAAPHKSPLRSLFEGLQSSRAASAAQSLMYRQADTYVPLYLNYGDKADFLRPPFTAPWRRRLKVTDQALGWMADRIHAQGLPFVLVFAPQQAQADIVASRKPVRGVDPLALNRAVEAIARRHGIVFRDVTPSFANVPDAPAMYLNVDGHLNAAGNVLIADTATQAVLSTPIGADACNVQRRG